MKKTFFILAVFFLTLVSCQKEQKETNNKENNCWWCNACNFEPKPVTRDGNIPDISWTEYNSVRDACFHFERIVRTGNVLDGTILNDPCYEHVGDTLKVYGWLWNTESSYMDISETWIANDKRYASGLERYPPRYGLGEGILLNNVKIVDSSFIRNKCYITGIIGLTNVYEAGITDLGPCLHLSLKLKVIDIYFEEEKK